MKILTHGYDWSVLKGKFGEVLGSAGKVTIGDNCFIGMNTVILKGTTIGNNTIIGAGSVVTGGEYPSDCVLAGNPARVICSLDEYREKRQKAQLSEAVEMVRGSMKRFMEKYHPRKYWLSSFGFLRNG